MHGLFIAFSIFVFVSLHMLSHLQPFFLQVFFFLQHVKISLLYLPITMLNDFTAVK